MPAQRSIPACPHYRSYLLVLPITQRLLKAWQSVMFVSWLSSQGRHTYHASALRVLSAHAATICMHYDQSAFLFKMRESA